MSEHDCYDYVRRYYGVPAYVGTIVRHHDKRGVLVRHRTQLHYVHVRFDGCKFSVPCHPTDELVYEPAPDVPHVDA